MTAKSVLQRPQGLRPRARTPTCPLALATPLVQGQDQDRFGQYQDLKK